LFQSRATTGLRATADYLDGFNAVRDDASERPA
jgi:hypothetical protein